MKKILSIICVVMLAFCVLGCTSCGKKGEESSVKLVAVEANNVGLLSDIDYYVVAEPAASARIKALKDLHLVGDLQKLYGGENGYPQAVVVAKNALFGTEKLKKFVDELTLADEWLQSESNSVETIVNAINSHLPTGTEPTLRPQILTKEVIGNCSINFVSAKDSKKDINAFMEKFNSIGGNAFGMPTEEFFNGNCEGNGEYSDTVSVYTPDGAPALGLAKLMAENALEGCEYNVINSNTVQGVVGGAQPKADICVLPVNLAVKLLGNANNYKLLGTLTHGNLYVVAKSSDKITSDSIGELKGKTVGVVNLAAVPGLTFKLILKNHGIEYSEPYND